MKTISMFKCFPLTTFIHIGTNLHCLACDWTLNRLLPLHPWPLSIQSNISKRRVNNIFRIYLLRYGVETYICFNCFPLACTYMYIVRGCARISRANRRLYRHVDTELKQSVKNRSGTHDNANMHPPLGQIPLSMYRFSEVAGRLRSCTETSVTNGNDKMMKQFKTPVFSSVNDTIFI